MQVAELFVQLGVKGGDKTVESLTGVEKGLKDVSGLALETKVALVGAFYALQQLFQSSGKTGTGLTNFSSLLGEGTKTLQQYQYALRQVGVSNEETESTFKNLSATATKAAYGIGGRPAGLAQIAKYTGGNISQQDLLEYAAHPEKFVQRIQQALKNAPESQRGLLTEAVRSLGGSDTLIAGLRRGDLTQKTLNKAPTYSDKEIAALDKANIAWSNLGTHIEMAIGHLNAAHGGKLVRDFTQLTDSLIKMSSALLKVGESAHVLQGLSAGATGLSRALNDIAKHIQGFKGLEQIGKDIQAILLYSYGFNSLSKEITSLINIFTKLGNVLAEVGKLFKIPQAFSDEISALSDLGSLIQGESITKGGAIDKEINNTSSQVKKEFGQFASLDFASRPKEITEEVTTFISNLLSTLSTNSSDINSTNSSDIKRHPTPLLPLASDHRPKTAPITNNVNHSPTVNQNINIYDSKNPSKTAEEIKKHTTAALTKSYRDTLRQNPALVWSA